MGNRTQKQRKNTVEARDVDVISTDVLASMSDEELIARRQELDVKLGKLLKVHGNNCAPLEVELAYVQREFQLRHARHELHGEYAAKLAAELRDILLREDSLPNVDFSNIDYVRLHAEYKHNANKRARC